MPRYSHEAPKEHDREVASTERVMKMAGQVLKAWILLGREKGQTKWELVDDPIMGPLREQIEDEKVLKFTSFIYWNKELAIEILKGMREGAEEKDLNQEYRIASLWAEVGPKVGRL